MSLTPLTNVTNPIYNNYNIMDNTTQYSVSLRQVDIEALDHVLRILYPLPGITEHTPLSLKMRSCFYIAEALINKLDEAELNKLRLMIANLDL
jgi:hypothetical protein